MSRRTIFAIASVLALAACGKGDDRAAALANQTAQACTPPRAGWMTPGPLMGGMPFNRISLTHAGAIYWNGLHTDLTHVTRYLSEVAVLNPEPVTFLQTEMGVSCALVEQVRDEMEHRLNCTSNGPCAEGIWSIWEVTPRRPSPPGAPIP